MRERARERERERDKYERFKRRQITSIHPKIKNSFPAKIFSFIWF